MKNEMTPGISIAKIKYALKTLTLKYLHGIGIIVHHQQFFIFLLHEISNNITN